MTIKYTAKIQRRKGEVPPLKNREFIVFEEIPEYLGKAIKKESKSPPESLGDEKEPFDLHFDLLEVFIKDYYLLIQGDSITYDPDGTGRRPFIGPNEDKGRAIFRIKKLKQRNRVNVSRSSFINEYYGKILGPKIKEAGDGKDKSAFVQMLKFMEKYPISDDIDKKVFETTLGPFWRFVRTVRITKESIQAVYHYDKMASEGQTIMVKSVEDEVKRQMKLELAIAFENFKAAGMIAEGKTLEDIIVTDIDIQKKSGLATNLIEEKRQKLRDQEAEAEEEIEAEPVEGDSLDIDENEIQAPDFMGSMLDIVSEDISTNKVFGRPDQVSESVEENQKPSEMDLGVLKLGFDLGEVSKDIYKSELERRYGLGEITDDDFQKEMGRVK